MSGWRKFWIHILLGLVISLNVAHAQSKIQFLDKSKGLSVGTISTIVEDNYGYIWVGTLHGLNRYNGIEMENYYHNDKDSTSIPNNNVKALCIDSKNNLWIGTYGGGLQQKNLVTGKVYNITTEDNGTKIETIQSMYLDDNNILWIANAETYLSAYDTENKLFLKNVDRLSMKTEFPIGITSVLVHKKQIFITTWQEGFYHYNSESGETHHVENNGLTFRCLQKSIDDKILIGTSKGAKKYDWQSKELTEIKSSDFSFSNLEILSIVQKKDGCIFYGSENAGLYIQTPENKWHNYRSGYLDNAYPISGNSIWSMYEDSNNRIWMGFYTKGLNMIEQLNPRITSVQRFKSNYGYKELGHVSGLICTGGDLWIATEGNGLLQMEVDGTIKEHNNFWSAQSQQIITSIELIDNKIWLGTWGEGVYIYDIKTKKAKNIKLKNDKEHSITGNYIHFINSDRYGNIWVGCYQNGIDILSKDGESLHVLDPNKVETMQFLSAQLLCDGNMILGAEGGELYKIGYNDNYQNTTVQAFKNQISTESIKSAINDIAVDSECNAWLASSDGLLYADTKSLKLKHATSKSYIASSSFHSINTMDGNVWISSSQGIIKYDPKKDIITAYNHNDGLLSKEFSNEADCVDSEGNIYFGNVSGLNYFNTRELEKEESEPNIIFDKLTINSEEITPQTHPEILSHTIQSAQKATLSHKQHDFSITFSTLNMAYNVTENFEYKLEGYDNEWITTTSDHMAKYNQMNHGHYTLLGRSKDREGKLSKVIKLEIEISAPWYLSTWAKLLYLFILALILYAIYSYYKKWFDLKKAYTSELENKNEKLEKKVAERTEILKKAQERERAARKQAEALLKSKADEFYGIAKSLESEVELKKEVNRKLESYAHTTSHDLKEPIRTIGAFTKLLKQKYSAVIDEKGLQYMDIIEASVKRMTNLITSILDYAKMENRQIIVEQYDINAMINDQLAGLELMIAENNASIKINDMPTISCDFTLLGMVFYNLINNGIKYNKTKTPEVTISYDATDHNHHIFSIRDNGIGIKKEAQNEIFSKFTRAKSTEEFEGSGIGLSTCLVAVKKHQGDIWIESELGKGSTFFFSVLKSLN